MCAVTTGPCELAPPAKAPFALDSRCSDYFCSLLTRAFAARLVARAYARGERDLVARMVARGGLLYRPRCCPQVRASEKNTSTRALWDGCTLSTRAGAGTLEQVNSASVVLLLHFFVLQYCAARQCSIVARELVAEGGQHDDPGCCLRPVECNGLCRCGRMRQAETR